jgi:Helix-turn-helix domain
MIKREGPKHEAIGVPGGAKSAQENLLKYWLSLPQDIRREKFADTGRAAEIAGVSSRTMRDWINAGFVCSLRIGKKYQISMKSLEIYLHFGPDRD